MHKNQRFLLESELANELYQEVQDLPVIDFFSHLSPRMIYKNEPFTDIAELWLNNDHYKWRLMRNSGVLEYQITGDDTFENKFKAYAHALERAYLNPLFDWAKMELKEYFDIDTPLTSENASAIYQQVNAYLSENNIGPRELLQKAKVEVLCTTADLNDDLEFHKLIKDDKTFDVRVEPIFQPDSLLDINAEEFFDVITLLEKSTSTTISGITTLAIALSKRLDYFNVNGCTIANHTIGEFRYLPVSKSEASKALKKRLMKYPLSPREEQQLKLYILKFFMKEYAIRDMVCQFHIGALHDSNDRMHQELGKDSGYDSISTHGYVDELTSLLSEIHSHYPLPKMVISNLNPNEFEAIASLCGNFSCQTPGKMQLGSAWWFNNHETGIEKQLKAFATYLNLSTFIGSPSNARSFSNYIRVDYFRRILANTLAKHVENGRIPNDLESLKSLMKDIAYNNAKHYFSY